MVTMCIGGGMGAAGLKSVATKDKPAGLKPGLYKSKNSNALEDAGGAHASADAHGDHAVARVLALEFAEDGGGELCAGAAERVGEGGGGAVWSDAGSVV